MKVLLTGVAGVLGRKVAGLLLQAGHHVVGLDRRPWPDAPPGVEMHAVDIRKRAAEDVFRTRRPDVVIHMATVTHFTASAGERYRINLHGTRAVFDHASRWGVKQAVFVGRHTFYGAAADAPLYFTEADPPLAVSTFPELADLVAADLFAGAALWRCPQLDTSVLRVCYTLGPSGTGTLATFLAGPRVPSVLGFDPLYQLIHEDDAADAIAGVVGSGLRGVFNVAGPQPLPLSVVVRQAGRRVLPVPQPLLPLLLGRLGLPHLPAGSINHLKFPVVVDDQAFRKATGFVHRWDELETVRSFGAAFPAPGPAPGGGGLL